MANYRNISLTFWTDSKVDDEFTPEDKYFYLYLLTNPHTNICGCYEISMKQMERETGYNTDTVKRLLRRMQETHKVIAYCEETKEILIVNWHKYNWTQSPNVKKAVADVAQYIKCEKFKKFTFSLLNPNISIKSNIESNQNTDNRIQYTDTDTDTDVDIGYEYPIPTVSETAKQKKKFSPPTVEEVATYCAERKNGIDANAFIDFYSANGWVQGRQGKPIKDWKACVRTWERNNRTVYGGNQQKTVMNPSNLPDDVNDLRHIFGD